MPFYNRPGFKLTRKGVDTLDDAELLSIIFWANDKEDDVLDISNKILKRYNLNKIEDAGYKELVNLICDKKKAEYKDFVKVMKLLSLVELSKRYNRLIRNGYKKAIRNAKDVYDYFIDEYNNEKKEYFICLYLDTKNNIIKDEVLSVGTLNSFVIHPREVFKSAIKESANSVILIHNHPSGDSEPSDEDSEITRILFEAGKLLSIRVLDHVIIGNGVWYSFKEKGTL